MLINVRTELFKSEKLKKSKDLNQFYKIKIIWIKFIKLKDLLSKESLEI